MTNSDPMQNPQIRQAMANLELAEASLDRAIERAKQVDQRTSKGGLSEQDIEKIEEFARSKDAPKELRELQKKVDDGKLSWHDIASPRHFNDPEIREALGGSVPGLTRAYQLIQEGENLDDIVDAGANQLGGPNRRSANGNNNNDDEDGGGSVLEPADW